MGYTLAILAGLARVFGLTSPLIHAPSYAHKTAKYRSRGFEGARAAEFPGLEMWRNNSSNRVLKVQALAQIRCFDRASQVWPSGLGYI